jgi:integrase
MSPLWSGGCPGSPGITANCVNRSTSATAISPPCWPASAAPMAARPRKRKPSSPKICSPCSASWKTICVACATRPILAIGFAGGLRRSEIVGLDCGPNQSEDGTGWIEIFGRAKASETANDDDAEGAVAPDEGGLLLTINGKTGWREVEIGRGSSPLTCPVAMLETWMRLGRIAHGPLFRPVARKNGGVGAERLTDKHVARLVQKAALAAGIRGDLSEGERKLAFSGHSLRAGLASSAQIEEAHVQRHLGHASAEMTRRYQRKRDRFRVNLTKAAGV